MSDHTAPPTAAVKNEWRDNSTSPMCLYGECKENIVMEEFINASKILSEHLKKETSWRREGKHNLKSDLKTKGLEDVNRINLAQDGGYCQAAVKMVMNFLVA